MSNIDNDIDFEYHNYNNNTNNIINLKWYW